MTNFIEIYTKHIQCVKTNNVFVLKQNNGSVSLHTISTTRNGKGCHSEDIHSTTVVLDSKIGKKSWRKIRLINLRYDLN